MKKIWRVFFASTLLLSIISPTVVSAAENIETTQNVVTEDDRTPIIDVSSLLISKKVATAGDELKLSIKIENSAYVGLVRVIYWDPGTQFFKILYLNRNINTGMHETTIKITENTFPGEYVVREVNTTDANGIITASYHYKDSTFGNPTDLSAANYTVVQTVPDTTGPTIDGNSLQLSPSDGTPGTSIGFSLTAHDESGVQEVIAHYLNPVTNAEEMIPFTYNETSTLFEGAFDVTEDTAAGEWSLTKITATDTLGNASEWENSVDPNHGVFTVTQPVPDTTGPAIDGSSLRLSTPEGTPGTTIGFSLGVQDESGVQEVIAHYLNLFTNEEQTIPFTYNETSTLFEGSFDVTSETGAGEWRLTKITATDTLGNANEWDNAEDSTHGAFTITQPDTTGPMINGDSLQLSTTDGNPGAAIDFTLNVQDESGVQEVVAHYLNLVTNEEELISFTYNETTDLFESSLEVTGNTAAGEWRLTKITATDTLGNASEWENTTEPAFGAFTITQPVPDTTGPVINGSSLQLSTADGTPGTTIGFSLDVQDESGVKEVIAHYLNPVTKEEEVIPFTFNEKTALFEGIFEVTGDTAAGEWILTKISAKDELDNASELDNSADPTNGAFKVTQPDTTGPVINGESLQLSTTDGAPGTAIGFSVEIQDESGIQKVVAHYLNPSTNEEEAIPFTYNETTSLFEGTFEVTSDTAAGEWRLTKITAEDTKGNANEWENSTDPTHGAFTVTHPDTIGPVIDGKSLQLSTTDAIPGTTIDFTLDVRDESGMKEVIAYYLNPETKEEELVSFTYNGASSQFESSFEVKKDTVAGEWVLTKITAKDTLDNTSGWENSVDSTHGAFTVTHPDTAAPIIEGNSLKLSTNESIPGSTIDFTLDVQDESGVKEVIAYYLNPITKEEETISFTYNEASSQFEGTFEVSDDTAAGEWILTKITAKDTLDNASEWENSTDPTHGMFTVTHPDTAAPIIEGNSLKLSTNEAIPGTTIDFTLDVQDESGVKEVIAYYLNPVTKVEEIILFTHNETSYQYEGAFEVTDDTAAGEWHLTKITAEDKLGNTSKLDNSENPSRGAFTVTKPIQDTAGPQIDGDSLQLSTTDGTAGTTISFSLDVQDDSGVKKVVAYYLNPETKIEETISFVYDEKTKLFEGTFKVTDETASGEWLLMKITAEDTLGNSNTLDNSQKPTHGAFTVTHPIPDSEGPKIDGKSLQLSTTDGKPGTTIRFSLDVQDESGVKKVTAHYLNPGTKAEESISFTYNEKSSLFEGTFEVTNDTAAGEWKLTRISAEDKLGNFSTLDNSKDPAHGAFIVTQTVPDTSGPKIDGKSLRLSTVDGKPGTTINFNLDVQDESGVKKVVAQYLNPVTKAEETITFTYNEKSKFFEGKFDVTTKTASGKWLLMKITAEDKLGNTSTLDNSKNPSYGAFTVTQPDTTGPKINDKSLQLSATDGEPGTTIHFSLDVQDESGVKKVIVYYLNPKTNAEESISFIYNEKTKLFEGTFKVTTDTAAGEWRLMKITAEDKAGNVSILNNSKNPTLGAFKVTHPDKTGPKINSNSLQLSTTDGKPGTTIIFKLDVQDESGVKKVIAHYLNPVTKSEETIVFAYNEKSKLFEGKFEVTSKTAAGKWQLLKITSEDTLGNSSTLDNSKEPSYGAFTVTQLDMKGPEVDWKSLTLSAKEVTVGEKILVGLNISDPSDIQTATLVYRMPGSSKLHSLTLVKNAKTGRFEATLTITKETAIGEWNLDSITAKDKAANVTTIYNSKFHNGTNAFDLSKGQFKVLNKKGEVTRPVLSYSTYIQGSGWQKSVAEGETSGTKGEAKRLEAIKIDLSDSTLAGKILYRTHVEKNGWLDWVKKGEMSGTKGESKRLEAIEIKLTDELAATYDIYYRVHTQKFGWLDWAKNGDPAGTAGFGYRLEAIEIRLVEKGKPAPGKTNVAFWDKETQVGPGVHYSTYIQKDGWQNYRSNGQFSGTTGQAKRLEAIKIQLKDLPYQGGVEYQTHVQNAGWLKSVSSGEMSGTQGESKRLEAIRIKLTGEIAKQYDIYYRVHVQSLGWLDWAKNGESAGTEGLALRLEGIEVMTVKKGDQVPGKTKRPFVVNKVGVSYTAHVQKAGWQNPVFNGILSGTTGKALRLEGIKLNIQTDALSGGIQYRAHIQKAGWQNWKENGQLSGTEGKSLRLEAIQIKLTGEMAKLYDIYYRVHVQGHGWMDWTKNGQPAGTEGLATRLEGIQVKLVRKGYPAPGSTKRPFIKK